MNYIITAVAFVVIFSILVLVHELGHFFVAKRTGVKVEEFGFGLPPRMFGKKIGETIYSINWIPFGGFVRMLGEDSRNAGMLKNKRSFIAQSARNRLLVIIAGVVMNFFLAWILLTVGFSVGMKPLLLPENVFKAIDDGNIVLQEGLEIKTVEEGGFIDEMGLASGDIVVSFNDKEVNEDFIADATENPVGTYGILKNNRIYTYKIDENEVPADFAENGLQAEFYDAVSFPRVGVFNVENDSSYYLGGHKNGDIILSVNGSNIYSVREFEELIRGVSKLDMVVSRNFVSKNFSLILPQKKQIIVDRVLQDMPAKEAGLKDKDIILAVNGNEFEDVEDLVNFTEDYKLETLKYSILRGEKSLNIDIAPNNDGQIGAWLSELMTYAGNSGISLYNADIYSSVVEIKDETYPVHVAMYKSLIEMGKISKVTAEMFVNVVADILSQGSVPDSVSGPVGIAAMTHTVVNEGLVAVLRFVALLSLSLAVINILPFPALDGGRLLFIVVEFIIGRRVNQRLESFVHGLCYFLLLFLILIVTYSDVIKLFTN
jgi:regulator of sigma E protease